MEPLMLIINKNSMVFFTSSPDISTQMKGPCRVKCNPVNTADQVITEITEITDNIFLQCRKSCFCRNQCSDPTAFIVAADPALLNTLSQITMFGVKWINTLLNDPV